jgi:uncharacterized protein YkwD
MKVNKYLLIGIIAALLAVGGITALIVILVMNGKKKNEGGPSPPSSPIAPGSPIPHRSPNSPNSPPGAPPSSPTALSQEMQTLLDLQNKYRAQTNPPTSALTWDSGLEQKAQSWASYLSSRGCSPQTRPDPHPDTSNPAEAGYLCPPGQSSCSEADTIGQNIARFQGDKGSAEGCIQGWIIDECKNYYNVPGPGENKGHFSQIMWASTTKVGCANLMCADGTTVWVCDYSPAGNVIYNGSSSEFTKNVRPITCPS